MYKRKSDRNRADKLPPQTRARIKGSEELVGEESLVGEDRAVFYVTFQDRLLFAEAHRFFNGRRRIGLSDFLVWVKREYNLK